MPDCPVREQVYPSPVPEFATVPDWAARCWNTDAGGIGLDADAQIWT